MPTILYVQVGGSISTRTEDNEPMHGHAVKGASIDCIRTVSDALILIMEGESVSIPWEKCSDRLAHASLTERSRAKLSPSGYGIHWPLIDEDLAVGPLLRAVA